MKIVKAAAAYFALAFGAGFVLGVIRVLFLVPRLGERTAELCEMPFMFVVVVLSARFVVKRFKLPPAVSVRLATGFLALGMLLIAELVLAVALQDRSLAQYIASRDTVSGGVYLGMLALFAMMPLIVARLQRPNARQAG